MSSSIRGGTGLQRRRGAAFFPSSLFVLQPINPVSEGELVRRMASNLPQTLLIWSRIYSVPHLLWGALPRVKSSKNPSICQPNSIFKIIFHLNDRSSKQFERVRSCFIVENTFFGLRIPFGPDERVLGSSSEAKVGTELIVFATCWDLLPEEYLAENMHNPQFEAI